MVFWPTKMLHVLGGAFLNGYQSWEFRTTCHQDYDLLKGFQVFEKQWVYFLGLALPSQILIEFIDTVGAKIWICEADKFSPKFGTLVVVPFLIMLSHDPEGCGHEIFS
jgi:hypothetical protein